MEIIDNINRTVAEDLNGTISKGSKLSIASAYFTIYAFEELKKELKSIDSLRFVFTSPSFLAEKTPREKREFYIPRLSRERSIYGTEFEIRLRNALTQKAVAKECTDWIRSKCEFRSNKSNSRMNTMLNVESGDVRATYSPFDEFSTVGLGIEKGECISNYVTKMTGDETANMFNLFDQIWNNQENLMDVKEELIERLTEAYEENPPEFIYFVTLYNIFHEFLTDISGENIPDERTGLFDSEIWKQLYSFQKDAVRSIISKLDSYNGCILADSVGLGKTYTALGVIKYYESRNKNVLVLCPKKLSENWNTYRSLYRNNPLISDRFQYKVLYHTDLSRKRGESNGIDLARFVWESFDLVVIDESHTFRNGGDVDVGDDVGINRYTTLLNDVVRKGVQTKVLMLSATPVNNRFYDLYYQLKIAYEGEPRLMQNNLDVSRPLENIFKDAQKAFNAWSKLEPDERTTENLLNSLDFDFFKVLDSVTIARSRKHIEKYYGMDEIGGFPERLRPINKDPGVADDDVGVTFKEVNDSISKLNLGIYVPTEFIMPSLRYKYGLEEGHIDRAGREMGIRKLMSINLLKRLESSVYSFRMTVNKVRQRIERTLADIDRFANGGQASKIDGDQSDLEGEEDETYTTEHDLKIDLKDMDYLMWRIYLEKDLEVLKDLDSSISLITPEKDKKLLTLKDYIVEKIDNPINPGNRKILIFTSFSDTADYLYDNIADEFKKSYGLNVAEVTGTVDSRSTLSGIRDFNDALTWFSPVSKNRHLINPDATDEIDILIGTDCISEGQNLQDCDCCVNYDIHWNPVRIIQRFGRVDRIGSSNKYIQLVNFWPDVGLDSYIDLRDRVISRMKASVLSATGDDNILDSNEKGDLEYRRSQLQRMRDEVVDIEEMQSGVSILDLGLNEFRIDLLDYTRDAGELDNTPPGLHAVVPSTDDMPPGVIFILYNRTENLNRDKLNRLHPFYMIYMGNDGSVICNHLDPKKLLDLMRYSCKGKSEIYKDLCSAFNEETKDGHDMSAVSELLSKSIDTIIDRTEQSELEDFLKGKDSFSTVKSHGLDDFLLICFLVVR